MVNIEKKETESTNLFETKIPSKSNKYIHFKCTHIEKKLLAKKSFKTIKKRQFKNIGNENISNRIGYWNKFEHIKFIEALYLYNCNWSKMKSYIKDRTYSQIRSHAQKFYNKLKSFKDEELGVDFTSPHVKSLNDIVNIVKDNELISNNNRNLLYTISEKISFGKSPYKKEINPKNRKTKNANINNKIINTNDYINNTNYINNKNDNLIINENLFKDNEESKDSTLNFLKYDNLLTLLQDSEDYLENSFDIDNKNYF